MEKMYQLIDYYIKNLCPDEQRGIAGDLRDKFTSFQKDVIIDVKYGYKNVIASGLFKNEAQIKKYLQLIENSFIEINERMIKNGRCQLFRDTNNLVESMDWRDKLLEYMPESECNKIVGCASFGDYEPPVFK